MDEKFNASSSNVYLLDFPAELLIYTLSFLDAKHLCRLMMVSKFFNQLANDEQLWQDLYRSSYGASEQNKHPAKQKYFSKLQEGYLKNMRRYYLYLSSEGDGFEVEQEEENKYKFWTDKNHPLVKSIINAAEIANSYDMIIDVLNQISESPVKNFIILYHFDNKKYKHHWQEGTLHYHKEEIDEMLSFVKMRKAEYEKGSSNRCLIS